MTDFKFKCSFHTKFITIMVLSGISPKVRHNMLSQQMKSCDGFEIETVGNQSSTDQLRPSFSTDTSSIALTNYNNQHKCNLCHPLAIRPRTHNNNASTLSTTFGGGNATLYHLLHGSAVEPLFLTTFGKTAFQLPLLNWICSYFGRFS